ncbi:MAG TPA: hypothetical protein VEU33_06770 [Archangium sp.]|nr:hypothetical protein [Archangium sp.]
MQEQFFVAVCEEQSWQVVDRHVAPRGHGAASQWVREQFSERVMYHRRWPREQRALLVGIDGDNMGVSERQLELDMKLRAHGEHDRRMDEAIALLVPTWSMETWLLFLHHGQVVPENQKSKGLMPAKYKADKERGTLKSEVIRQVRAGWTRGDRHPDLPSLDDGRSEVARLILRG